MRVEGRVSDGSLGLFGVNRWKMQDNLKDQVLAMFVGKWEVTLNREA